MAAPGELSLLENFPSRINQMDVLMLQSHWTLIFKTPDEPPTLLFTPSRPGTTGILLRVHALTAEEATGCAADEPGEPGSAPRVRLFASRLFMRHRGAPGPGSVRAARPVELQRVVVGSRGGAEPPLSGLRQACGPGRWLLGRQGEPLLVGEPGQELQELLVLECSPVTQGRIGAGTSLVLTDWAWAGPPPPPPCRPLRLCVSDFAQDWDALCRGRSLLDGGGPGPRRRPDCRVEVRVADARRWSGRSAGPRGDAPDVDSCVFVSKQLLLRLGLFDREWVRLGGPAETRGGSRAQMDLGERPAAVRAVDLGPDLQAQDDVAFISSTLWFNLSGGELVPLRGCSLRIKRWRSGGAGRSDSECRRVCPPAAAELHIRPVVSLLYDQLSPPDRLLALHFRRPRLVSQGDVLSVPDPLEEDPRARTRCPVRFFRVDKVCPSAGGAGAAGAHLADSDHTSLYSGGSTSSAVPCCCPEGRCSWSFLSAVGLLRPLELLSSIICPHLQHSSSLSCCTVLLHGPPGSGKTAVVRAASCRLHLHLLKVECVSVCADTPAAAESRLRRVFERAAALQPCVLLLRNLPVLTRSRGGGEEDGRVRATLGLLLRGAPRSVVVVATARRPRDLSAGVASAFVHQMALESLSEEQRHAVLLGLSRELRLGRDVSLDRLSALSAGFVLGDLRALLVQAGRAACRRLVRTSGLQVQDRLCCGGVTVLNQDFLSALETLQQAQSKAVGAPKIPRVHWDDVGGLRHVRKEILDTVQLPLQHPELLALGLSRTGVLLYGPPGTGKTLLAKAVATECAMTFLSVKGPELINMYVGQSEENIREVFHRARSAAPCVVFFDELDSLAPSRGQSGDSGGVMDRVVSQLLAELDALHCSAGVFVIGATNRPDLLDQSLLRPGRLDKLVYVGVSRDRLSQLQVLQAILRKFQLDPAVDLQELVDRCPAEVTGADLYALCSDAMTAAIKRKTALIDQGLDCEDSPVLLTLQDFSSALESFRPSVSSQELLRYRSLQQRVEASAV
ncbi:LOW QUALITY PROTEIN: peroxisome assembly factor 2 [Salarias fasciatus]|uniref:LOW QUALITY PROTEIN: peroxisome assembly factor 2 n=1 Tax=Salarias fasciatus TaxID=181472 RepID=UPI0011767886|nr:LOW QUALITY PROTEIN: peroxisome biogenesis factor 6 [Salarias fasciatus]